MQWAVETGEACSLLLFPSLFPFPSLLVLSRIPLSSFIYLCTLLHFSLLYSEPAKKRGAGGGKADNFTVSIISFCWKTSHRHHHHHHHGSRRAGVSSRPGCGCCVPGGGQQSVLAHPAQLPPLPIPMAAQNKRNSMEIPLPFKPTGSLPTLQTEYEKDKTRKTEKRNKKLLEQQYQ